MGQRVVFLFIAANAPFFANGFVLRPPVMAPCFPSQTIPGCSALKMSTNPPVEHTNEFDYTGGDALFVESSTNVLSQEQNWQDFSRAALMETWRKRDVNELINTAILVGTAVGVLYQLTTIDATMSRGWTIEEIAARIPISVWGSYSQVLDSYPVPTKACTSATVYAIGDVIAQRAAGVNIGGLDRMRIFRSMAAGLIGHGPLSHLWYNFADQFFDEVLKWTDWWSVFPKVLFDQATWGPFWNNTYILLLGIMKFEKLETMWADMKRTTVPLIVSGMKLWIPCHLITYGLIPVENRLLWVDIVEILWVTILASQAAGDTDGEFVEPTEQTELDTSISAT